MCDTNQISKHFRKPYAKVDKKAPKTTTTRRKDKTNKKNVISKKEKQNEENTGKMVKK